MSEQTTSLRALAAMPRQKKAAKPHICRFFGRWCCAAYGSFGYGTTPKEAYDQCMSMAAQMQQSAAHRLYGESWSSHARGAASAPWWGLV